MWWLHYGYISTVLNCVTGPGIIGCQVLITALVLEKASDGTIDDTEVCLLFETFQHYKIENV